MLLFQSYSQKPREDDDADEQRAGIKVKKGRRFLDEAEGEAVSVLSDTASAIYAHTKKAFKEEGLADFISSLSPGAQNAVYAASFAWGYENAVKYVKNAMKLEEVKNAHTQPEKSHAVVDSIKEQATREHQTEKISDVSRFAWSYYNEDLKEVQATAGKSEAITERDRVAQQEQQQMAQSAQQAVAMAISQGTHSPSLIYCTSTQEMAQQQEQKKEELARLVSVQQVKISPLQHEEAKIVSAQQAKTPAQQDEKLAAVLKDNAPQRVSAQAALERKEELEREYARTERELEQAMKAIEKLKSDDEARLREIAAALPTEISKLLISREKNFWKRRALRLQLSKWLAFCKEGRKIMAGIPASKLLKIVSLSSLLKQLKG